MKKQLVLPDRVNKTDRNESVFMKIRKTCPA
jgi:hypothetical protein